MNQYMIPYIYSHVLKKYWAKTWALWTVRISTLGYMDIWFHLLVKPTVKYLILSDSKTNESILSKFNAHHLKKYFLLKRVLYSWKALGFHLANAWVATLSYFDLFVKTDFCIC